MAEEEKNIRTNKVIKIHEAFGKEDLINHQWYKINIGALYTNAMWTNNFPLGESGFIRLNTVDYQKVRKGTIIDCWGGEIIGFSVYGEVVIDPKKYGLKDLFPSDPEYNSLLKQIMKTRNVQFI